MDLEKWTTGYLEAVRTAFGGRIVCVGVQGSYGRGEAVPKSDLDMVLVLDTLSAGDLRRYREAVSALPGREKLCGFVCGKAELTAWDKADALSLYRDTTPILGDLDFLRPLISREDIKRSVLTGACGLYHACCHNYLFDRDEGAPSSLRKSAFFLMRAEYEYRTGEYVKRRADLLPKLNAEEQALLEGAPDLERFTEGLLAWSGSLIRRYGDTRA